MPFLVGSAVAVVSLRRHGHVLEILPGGRFRVAVGGLTMVCQEAELETVSHSKKQQRREREAPGNPLRNAVLAAANPPQPWYRLRDQAARHSGSPRRTSMKKTSTAHHPDSARTARNDGPTRDVRLAMLGSGFVAGFYMQGLANVRGQQVVANVSRSAARARTFATKSTAPKGRSSPTSPGRRRCVHSSRLVRFTSCGATLDPDGHYLPSRSSLTCFFTSKQRGCFISRKTGSVSGTSFLIW